VTEYKIKKVYYEDLIQHGNDLMLNTKIIELFNSTK